MSTSGGDGHGRDGTAVEKSIVLPRQAPPRRTTTSKLITTSSVQLFLTVALVAAVALLPAGSLGSSLVSICSRLLLLMSGLICLHIIELGGYGLNQQNR